MAKLLLKDGAVPTLHCREEESEEQAYILFYQCLTCVYFVPVMGQKGL